MQVIRGGFQLNEADRKLMLEQRAITAQINSKFIQVGAVMLKNGSKNPFDEADWFKRLKGDTDLQRWIDDPDLEQANTGFNLQQGWLDIDIDASDPEFNRCIIAALDHLSVDTRFKFGRMSVGVPTHVMVQLGEEEAANFNELKKYEPKEFRYNEKRYHVQLRSMPTNIKGENVAREAKQTVVPGSIYSHKTRDDQYDLSVWYTSDGRIANDVRKVASTTPRRVNFNEIVRAIAFGTILYFIRHEWVEGNRQLTAQKFTGWLARVVADGSAMNNHEVMAAEVFCPVDTHEIAESLIAFICDQQNDDEKHMRIRAYNDAAEKLERNPDAKVPGWPAIEAMIGSEAVNALRTVVMPGSDVSHLSKMAERYLYDENSDTYVDRERFWTNGQYVFESGSLERRHKGDLVRVKGKSREAFKLFEASDMRKRIGMTDMHPSLAPGELYRINSIEEVISDDVDDKTALMVFNTWRGWPVTPTKALDAALMEQLLTELDWVLGMLTRDNQNQIEWVKKWLAWTFQNPGEKQQIAWVCVGGQGVGKSWLGNIFMKALMGNLWGTASASILEGNFSISPFKEKMFVFIDEAKFNGEGGTEEVKRLVRNVDVAGQEKFENARTHRIYARLMFASNRFDIGVSQMNVRDRALFYTIAYDKDHKGMSEVEFREWAETLKPRFDAYTELMKRRDVREHYVHYFMNLPVSRHEIESIKHSASGDPSIMTANMSWTRRIAKHIIEDCRIIEDAEIDYPFDMPALNARVQEVAKEFGYRNIQSVRVLNEFMEAGVVEKVTSGGRNRLRFVHRYADLCEAFGNAIGVQMEPRFEFKDDDRGLNDNDGSKPPKQWRGGGGAVRKF